MKKISLVLLIILVLGCILPISYQRMALVLIRNETTSSKIVTIEQNKKTILPNRTQNWDIVWLGGSVSLIKISIENREPFYYEIKNEEVVRICIK